MVYSLAIALVCVAWAYILGSIPTGYLVGRWLKNIDIRDYGSGSTGATNVLRTLGKKAGAAVLFCDAIKGMVGILTVNLLFNHPEWVSLHPETYYWTVLGVSLAAILGHSRSIFLGFKGGKSVAVSIGVLLLMSPAVALGTIAIFVISMVLTQIVSLSSISGAVAVIFLMILLHQPLPYIIFGAIAGTYVIVRHRANIQRILAGTEPKVGQHLSQ